MAKSSGINRRLLHMVLIIVSSSQRRRRIFPQEYVRLLADSYKLVRSDLCRPPYLSLKLVRTDLRRPPYLQLIVTTLHVITTG
jgi:hypothetical protein